MKICTIIAKKQVNKWDTKGYSYKIHVLYVWNIYLYTFGLSLW